MQGTTSKQFHLPWHQNDHYWISLIPKSGAFTHDVMQAMAKFGLQAQPNGAMAVRTEGTWKPVWDKVYSELEACGALDQIDACVTPGAALPELENVSNKSPAIYQLIAQSLWMGDALMEDRIICYLQPVMTANDKVFGYESFARVKGKEGEIIGGAQIVTASRALGIEHMIDRHLHVEAIKTFAGSAFNGFLFVNFFPGFIHRPAIYLEGLSDTVKRYGVVPKHIVLDFTNSETPRDSMHLKSVTDYGRSCGYSIALDDIASVEMAKKLIQDIRPDFVKIDMELVRRVQEPERRDTIHTIVDMAHAGGSTVIAESVETAETLSALKQLGVDLFQGYLFSPPVPVEAALKRGAG